MFREADLLAYDDAYKSATKLCERANQRPGAIIFLSNTGMSGDGNDLYSSGERIETFSKAYGGRGFKISPEVLEFRRNIVAEYLLED